MAAAACVGAASDSDSLRQLVLAMDGVLSGEEEERGGKLRTPFSSSVLCPSSLCQGVLQCQALVPPGACTWQPNGLLACMPRQHLACTSGGVYFPRFFELMLIFSCPFHLPCHVLCLAQWAPASMQTAPATPLHGTGALRMLRLLRWRALWRLWACRCHARAVETLAPPLAALPPLPSLSRCSPLLARFVLTVSCIQPACSDEKWMHEPAVAGLLREQQGVAPPEGAGPGAAKWRRRRPRWLVAEKVFLNLEWRASQASAAAAPALPPSGRSLHSLHTGQRTAGCVGPALALVYLESGACLKAGPSSLWGCPPPLGTPDNSPRKTRCALPPSPPPQAAYRPWASVAVPAPPLDYVPPLAVQLVREAVRFATHSYPVGSRARPRLPPFPYLPHPGVSRLLCALCDTFCSLAGPLGHLCSVWAYPTGAPSLSIPLIPDLPLTCPPAGGAGGRGEPAGAGDEAVHVPGPRGTASRAGRAGQAAAGGRGERAVVAAGAAPCA
jgi:hypothetical protein